MLYGGSDRVWFQNSFTISVAKKDNTADVGTEEETVFDPFSDDADADSSDKNKKASIIVGKDSAIAQVAISLNYLFFVTNDGTEIS